MDLLKQTKEICNLYNIRPARSKGQNFLVSSHVYNDIVNIADIGENDNILEIGSGLGFLTFKLADIAKKVVSIELDDILADILKYKLEIEKKSNVKVLNNNVLKVDISKIFKDDFKVVANIPYNITSIFLRKLFSGDKKPKSTTLLMQKEVAQRIIAKPGNMSMLAVSVQYYNMENKIERIVKSGNFWPKPRVDSAIINMKLKDSFPQIDTNLFFKFVKAGFSSKRKMLKNNLIKVLKDEKKLVLAVFEKLKLNRNIRAQELSIEEWINLFISLKDKISLN